MSEGQSFVAWCEGRAGGTFTEWLRAGTDRRWAQATEHRFVDELAAGTLSDEHFRRYLIQDYAFIETLVTVLGFAVARAPDMPAKKRWVEFLAVLTSEENDYFHRAFAAIGVRQDQWQQAELSATTQALREVMLAAANAGHYADILSVVVPAEWVYLTWASARSEARPSQPRYAEWIDLHAVPEFAAFVRWLRSELDTVGARLAAADQAVLAQRFAAVLDLEVAFFDQAYEN